MAAVPHIRTSAWLIAAALVVFLTAAALLSTWRVDRQIWPDAAAVTSITASERSAPASASPRAPSAQAPAMIAPSTLAAPGATQSSNGGLAALRCATLEQRRRNPECASGPSYADAQGRDLAPAPVEGVQTRDGALGRAILRGVNARAENYALGEAQKYADPREDPLYEEGSDPATAAHRPCPPGTSPRGDGRNLRGRSCQPVR